MTFLCSMRFWLAGNPILKVRLKDHGFWGLLFKAYPDKAVSQPQFSSVHPVVLVRIIVHNLIVHTNLDVALSYHSAVSMNMAPDQDAESLFCGWYISIFGESHIYSGLEAWQLLKNDEEEFEETSTNKVCRIGAWQRHCPPICSRQSRPIIHPYHSKEWYIMIHRLAF